MTEPLGLTPSQTVGPYLSIGFARRRCPVVDRARGRPARNRRSRQVARWSRGSGAGRHGRVLAGERGGALRAPGRYTRRRLPRGRVLGLRPLRHGRRRLVPARHAQAGASARARRAPPGPAHSRRRLRARVAQAPRDPPLLPRRGGGERRRSRALRARRERACDARGHPGERRAPLRHSPPGQGQTAFFLV